ncbi:hypothetical protein IFM89_039558 [Coptis chinensis]|uniref:WUSCHEL-related homeobox 11 n=1 Tax=Coptis chinensis TaxID=261450 RepID=A0A835L9N9_9MAGN|nr:hypothetical protein IFM89_039558 [Coptis chinensis]
MGDQETGEANSPRQGHGHSERSEPVRSRWTPKPEQILILESIFNSGMVNPPKDETVRIRKLLKKFGSVGDANVFYCSCSPSSPDCLFASASSNSNNIGGGVAHKLFSVSQQMAQSDIHQNSILCPSNISTLPHYQSGSITVFINGVATEVTRGPLDIPAMLGQNVMLVHSSGMPVPINEYGISLQSLQMGESYFLVTGPK